MTLTVHRSGKASGQAIVMLHGWGMNSAVWGDVVNELNESFDLYRIDLPGHGESPATAATGELDDWANAVLEAAPREAIWIGWSLGGMIAQRAALLSPERIRALMLVTSTPCFMQRDDWSAGMVRQTLEQFSSELMKDAKRTLIRFLGLQVRGSSDERTTLKRLRAAINDSELPAREALTNGLHLLNTVDLRDQVADLTPPTSWLFGEKDALVSAATAAFINTSLPGAKTVEIPGSGHAPFLSHPTVSILALEMLVEQLPVEALS